MDKDQIEDGGGGTCLSAKKIPTENRKTLNLNLEIGQVTVDELNNFFCNMPGGFYRSSVIQKAAFRSNETFHEAYKRFCIERNKTIHSTVLIGYSSKKLEQTPEDFFREVDVAIDQCCLSIERVKEEVSLLNNDDINGPDRASILSSLNKQLMPVYFTLRAMGYSHRDLVG